MVFLRISIVWYGFANHGCGSAYYLLQEYVLYIIHGTVKDKFIRRQL